MISFPLKIEHGQEKDIIVTLGIEYHKIFFSTSPYNQALLEEIKDFIDNIVANINAEYRKRSLNDELIHSEFFKPEDNKVCYWLEKQGDVISSEKFWNFLLKIRELENPHKLKIFSGINEARDISFTYDEFIRSKNINDRPMFFTVPLETNHNDCSVNLIVAKNMITFTTLPENKRVLAKILKLLNKVKSEMYDSNQEEIGEPFEDALGLSRAEVSFWLVENGKLIEPAVLKNYINNLLAVIDLENAKQSGNRNRGAFPNFKLINGNRERDEIVKKYKSYYEEVVKPNIVTPKVSNNPSATFGKKALKEFSSACRIIGEVIGIKPKRL